MEFNLIPGEKFLIKLWDTIADKGIGSLLKPIQTRRVGAAAAEVKRLNALVSAQTKMDVAAINAGSKILLTNGKLVDSSDGEGDTTFLGSANSSIIAEIDQILINNARSEALRREVSVAKAILHAEQEFECHRQTADSNAQIDQTPVSDDWLLRWRDNAASVSSDELQVLWGKVLAGEVEHPGTFSLRTLEFLRHASREEAALIEKLAPYVIKNCVVRPDPSTDQIGDLSLAEFLLLQDLGILSGVEALGMTNIIGTTTVGKFTCVLMSYGRGLLVSHEDAGKKLELPVYLVTRLGQEVLRLGWKRADETYLRLVGNFIKQKEFEVQIGDCENVEGGI